MPEIFLYRRRQTQIQPPILPFMLFSVAWLRLITLSLLTLPFVSSHEDVICKFGSS
jgi:hypothetical protein